MGDKMGWSSLPGQTLASKPPTPVPVSSPGGLGTAMAPMVTPFPWGLPLPTHAADADRGRFVSPLVPPSNDRMKYVCPAKRRGRTSIFQIHEAESEDEKLLLGPCHDGAAGAHTEGLARVLRPVPAAGGLGQGLRA